MSGQQGTVTGAAAYWGRRIERFFRGGRLREYSLKEMAPVPSSTTEAG